MSHDLSLDFAPLPAAKAGTIVIYVEQDGVPEGEAKSVWDKTGKDFAAIAKSVGFSGKPGHMIDLVAPPNLACDRLLVLGRGKNGALDALSAWTDRGGSLMAKLEATRTRSASVILDEPGLEPRRVAELAAGAKLRRYRFDKYRTTPPENGPEAMSVTFVLKETGGLDDAVADRMAVVEGTLMARTLVNEPANVLGPVEFAGIANRLSDLGITVETLTPEDMADHGMGALLAVAQGSERPARLVVMQWRGGNPDAAPLAFIGKGVVFDTGGISIKPAANMEDMKGDMGGAAAVTGLMKTLALRKAKVNAVGVIGLVENMADGRSYRPGDIVTAMSGKTIEIVNTDAEGRLVLADALWYTQERFRPRLMVDLATLTGAALVALGHDHAALFCEDDATADKLFAAGQETGEKLWRMPFGQAYEKLIESRFADIKNSGGRKAGSITAAHFLRHFVNGVPWAHIDIAGTAFGANPSETNASWATGYGVAVLDRFIRDHGEGERT
ncbi:leucyl aminopeptidase [Pelagibacterium halotolerans]|uniref:leucyl aminopeptidase n=1 Tax=Pelagibacterium halotolerans TaxID=531813 RepID=UPI00384C6674